MTSKFVICIIFGLFVFGELNSQNVFQLQNPVFRPEPVFTMDMIDGNLFLGGAYGLLIKSGNGGQNWSEININTKSEIRIITSHGTDTGLLYTADSSLYRSLNGGLNWTQIMKFNFAVYDIAIPNHNTVYLSASNRLGKSSNGGVNWRYFIPDSSSVNNYFTYHFIDSNRGFLSAIDVNTNYAMIFKTTDSGTTWTKYNSTVDNFIIQKLYFLNSFTGWAAGSRFGNLFLLRTTNGGINWSEQNTGQFEASVNGLYFRNLNEGFIATNLNILKTTNGGLNWIEYIQDYGISSSCFTDDSIIYLSDMNGRLIKVNIAGQADTLFGKKNFRLDNIFAASGNNIWISGGGYRNFRSTNGGQSWYYDLNSYSLQLKKIFFLNSNTGFAIAGRGKVMATSDFGINWQLIYNTNEEFSNIYFLNTNTGWVSGIGSIWKTVNGGSNWITSSLNGNIIKMWFSDSNIGFSIMNDSMQKTTDGGITWHNQKNSHVIDLSFLNPNTGWTLNYSDTTSEIRNTTNGGLTYNTLSRLPNPVSRIQFADILTGYLSSNRSVSRTTDGGLTWKKADFPVSEYLNVNDFYFLNSNTGWFCGDNGLILFTSNGTSININKLSVLSDREQLSLESYPNPFNNQATIKFSIPEGGETALRIYNICGEEVFRFQSKYFGKGNKGIKFDGTELASGVYFITLKFKEITITQKIMLVK